MTITTERLRTIAGWREKYGNGHNVVIPAEEAEAIASELLAAREAVPVAFLNKGDVDTTQTHILAKRCRSLACTLPVYTAPPAPAVPREIPSTSPVAAEYVAGWNACRAAMLEHVSQGYKLNSPEIPDGWKLVPIDMTDAIGEAIAMEANCCGGIALDIYKAALAAAPSHSENTLDMVSDEPQEVKS